jgi:outer membrane protein assembly factor BamD (BamD/ComL family)
MKKFFCLFYIISHCLLAEDSSAQDIHNYIVNAFEENDWMKLLNGSKAMLDNYQETTYSDDAAYYLGVAYFNLKDYAISNDKFSQYLKQKYNPKFFYDSINYKFLIAEQYKTGKRKRLFKWTKAPKIASGKEDALQIYDEIISIMPNHELAMKSLFSKGQILSGMEEYKESVETYQKLIYYFPQSDLAIESFVGIADVYLKQSRFKSQDPHLLEMAEINLAQMESVYPNSEKIKDIKNKLSEMKEEYAKNFYDIGYFYEKTHKKQAAILYYSKVISSYPDTNHAKLCQKALKTLR